MSDFFNQQFDAGLVLEQDYINLRLINEINLRHPRKFDAMGKPEKYSFCEGFGYFGFREEDMFVDMNKFGVGLVDYFRILKLNLLFYFILALFAFLSLYSCGENFSKIDDIKKMFNFSSIKDFLVKLSLGNTLSKDYYKCQVENITDINSIAIQCDYYPKNNYFYLVKDSLAIFETSKETDISPYESICNNYVNNMKYDSPFKSSKSIDISTIKKYTSCNSRHSVCTINLEKIKSKLYSLVFVQYRCIYSNKYFYDSGRNALILFFSLFSIVIYILYFLYL